MNRVRLLGLIVGVAACLAAWAGARGALAAEEPAGTVIEVDSMPAQDERGKPLEGQYWITVVLTTADGRYVAGRPIQIVEPVDFFGPREAKLGTAVTDGTGFAAVVYQPSRAGEHNIVVRFRGDKQYAASKAELVVEAADVVAPFTEEPLPLASVGTGLAVFLGVLGVVFWTVLLGVLGRMAWRIKTAPAAAVGPARAAGARSQEVPI
jgi:hypothetical protein